MATHVAKPKPLPRGLVYIREVPPPSYCAANPRSHKHHFLGWRDFPDGNGGEAYCEHCGMGAMEFSLRMSS